MCGNELLTEVCMAKANIASPLSARALGAISVRKMVLPGMVIPMLKIRRPNGRLTSNMEIAIRR